MNTDRRGSSWGEALGAFGLALLVTLVFFCAAPLLLRGRGISPGKPYELLPAFLPIKTAPPPREDEEKPPPPPPPKVHIKKMKLDPTPRDQVNLEAPELELEINPKLAMGPALLAPRLKTAYGLGEVDRAPLVTGRIPPPYPYSARRRGVQGWVKIRFLVDRKGSVRRISVVEAQPSGVFEESVLRSVSRWRFRPGIKDGRPVDTWVETTIRFKLEGRW